MRSIPSTVPAYIAAAPKESRVRLRQLRAIVRSAAPDAKEVIKYGMPGYVLHDRPLVYFAGYGRHVGVYALGRSLPALQREELKRLVPSRAGKASLRFLHAEPFPTATLKKLIRLKIRMVRRAARA